ncbi:Hypothetical protein Minf_1311 [Methylacidiphilum infernorum V4]|uniref:Uncharacterized protein n=1 Tax=Methylacidiphilum infernorum (isolate V4) TaxID=481448 RepID=B3DVL2_METI4|nr:Hypothetical protein Minf_1311 [Methylacidiphilum infernorum V4]
MPCLYFFKNERKRLYFLRLSSRFGLDHLQEKKDIEPD